jgi:hypothetical protein
VTGIQVLDRNWAPSFLKREGLHSPPVEDLEGSTIRQDDRILQRALFLH